MTNSKKSLFLGMTALLAVSFVFFSCGGGDAGAAGGQGPAGPGIFSGDIDPDALQAAVDMGLPIIFGTGEIKDFAFIDLKNAKVTVAGALTFESGGSAGEILNATNASFTFGTNGTIDTSNSVFIAKKALIDDVKVTGSGTEALFITGSGDLTEIIGTDTAVAIENYTLTATSTNIPAGSVVYVLGTLTVPTTVVAPSGGIVALGKISVSGDTNLASVIDATVANGKIVVAKATLTNSAAATVTLPVTAALAAVEVGANDLTLAGAATSITIGKLTTAGAGKLVPVTAATLALTVGSTAGTANIGAFTAVDSAVLTFSNGTYSIGAITLGGTSNTIAGNGAVALAAAPVFTGPKLIISNTAGVTLKEGASLADQKIIVLTNASLVVDTGKKIALVNTDIGPGTYTATGTITINSLTTADTIVTGAVDATDSLAIGTTGLILGEISTATTNPATYTFTDSADTSPQKVVIDGANGITVPAATTDATAGAIFQIDNKAKIALGDGQIRVGQMGSSLTTNGGGKLILATDSQLDGLTETANGKTTLSASNKFKGSDAGDNAGSTISTFSSANASGLLTLASGANGAFAVKSTGAANSSYSVIDKALALE